MEKSPAKILLLITATALLVGCSGPPETELSFEGEWPQWRGPTRDGHVPASELSVARWPEGELDVVWRRSMGPGFASVAISGGRLLTLEADGDREWLVALDAATGRRLWRQALGERYESFHGDGPRSTPAISGQVAVAMGALGGLVAVEVADGTPRWRLELMELTGGDREDWGFASSPLIDDGRVYVHGAEGATVLAVDLEGGEILWRLDLGAGGYASPRLVEIDGRRQLLSFLGAGLFGLDSAPGVSQDARVLWRVDWPTYYDLNAADPVLLSPREIFISSNYATGAGLVEFTDVLPSTDSGPRLRWKNPRVRNHWSSSVTVDGTIVGFDKSFLVAVDPVDGRVLWKERGFGEGSLLAAGRHLVVVGEDGTVALGAPSAAGWAELRRHGELLEGPVRAAPALVGGLLFLRGSQELIAVAVDVDSG